MNEIEPKDYGDECGMWYNSINLRHLDMKETNLYYN